MSEREAFEAWAKTSDWQLSLIRCKLDLSYLDDCTQCACLAWQAQQAKVDVQASRITELEEAIDRQGKVAKQAIRNSEETGMKALKIAQDIRSELKPELLESEREMNSILTNENLRLEGLVDEQQKRIDAARLVIDQAKDGFYGYSNEGGSTDELAFDLEQALRGGHENN